MNKLGLSAGQYAATVTSVGATPRELRHREAPIVLGFDADDLPGSARGQLLAPWPNRLPHGAWTWKGRALQLPVDEPHRGDAANHGLLRWCEWTVVECEAASAVLEHLLPPTPGYPFAVRFVVRYAVEADRGLVSRLRAVNQSAEPAPVALGTHPYLRPLGGGRIEVADLRIPAAGRLLVDGDGTPAGVEAVAGTPHDFRSARRLGDLAINDAFCDLIPNSDGVVRSELTDGTGVVALECGSSARWLQVYTADGVQAPDTRCAVAVEPMTAPPAALATGDGLAVLDPGEALDLEWCISATGFGAGRAR